MNSISSMTHRLGDRSKKLIASVGLLALIALALAAAAGAETMTTQCRTGECGVHSTTWASCDTAVNGLQVHAPTIKSTWVNYPGNLWVQPNHVQFVRFRSWLLRYNGQSRTWDFTDQNGDGYADHGPLLQAQVQNGNEWDPPTSWYNVDQGRIQGGTFVFPIRYGGYYRVLTNYYWAADQFTGGGFDALVQDSDYFVSTGVTVISTPWCQYGV
jgi:hypothetical protein